MIRSMIYAVIIFLPAPAFTAEIYVPDDYPTIQAAIEASHEGDNILVRAGVYHQPLDFMGKAIIVRNIEEPFSAIIDAGGKDSAVSFKNGEGPDSVLAGFLIRNGDAHYGGGICCIDSSPTLMNNDIRSNSSLLGGGAISCRNSSPEIRDNHVTDNEAVNGGGIYCYDHSNPIITDNRIFKNRASDGAGICCNDHSSPKIIKNEIDYNTAFGDGGGISCQMFCSPLIEANYIHHNICPFDGAGILCEGNGDPEIVRNKIYGNNSLYGVGVGICCKDYVAPSIRGNVILFNESVKGRGGGISIMEHAHPTIENNLICGNYVGSSGGGLCYETHYPYHALVNNTIAGNMADHRGGGVLFGQDIEIDITNTIFWDNESNLTGKEICVFCDEFHPTTLNISYSDICAFETSIHLDPGGSINWGTSVIDSDPLFADVLEGDWHLEYSSPCRDAGNNLAVIPNGWDFEGDPRIAHGTVDMGADEFYTHLYYTGKAKPGIKIKGKLVGLPGTAPVGLFLGSQMLDPPLPTMWGLFHIKMPWILLGSLGSVPPDGIMVLPANINISTPVPYDIFMQALIGSELSNLCVLEVR